jgi:hypothetical protein
MSETVEPVVLETSTTIHTPDNKPSKPMPKPKPKKSSLELQKEKDLMKVRGRFEFTEIVGKNAPLEFSYGSIYEDVPVFNYRVKDGNALFDGQIYELPFCIAKHLNETGQYPVHQYALDETGKSHIKVSQKIRRYGFYPVDFNALDVGQNDSKIIGVEKR